MIKSRCILTLLFFTHSVLADSKADLSEIRAAATPEKLSLRDLPNWLGGTGNEKSTKALRLKDWCRQDEADFEKLRRNTLFPLEDAVRKRNLSTLTLLSEEGFRIEGLISVP